MDGTRQATGLIGKQNWTWLLGSMLLLILLLPLAQAGRTGRLLLSALATLVLLGGLRAVSTSVRHLVWGVILFLPAFITQWLAHLFADDHGRIWMSPSFYSLPFFIFLAWSMLRFIFHAGPVTKARLQAALCLYLIIGLLWAHLYVVVLQVDPGAFKNPTGLLRTGEMIYYSYVTLTTLGYGDITPVSAMARSFSVMEATVGVLTIGTLVARLAGAMKFDQE